MSTNLVLITGTLSRHELRYTAKGTPFLEISLVGKRNIGENHIFFRSDFTFYGKLAEGWAEQLQEGQAYQASGRLEYESWEVDGVKGSRLRIVGDELHSLEHADVREEERGPILYGAENRVLLLGGLTADPDIRQTSLKTPVAKANLGFSSWDATAGQSKSHYVELEAWREVAVQFADLKKGAQVLVEGSLKTEVWEDKETKTKRYKRVLEAQRVTPLKRIRAASKGESPALSDEPAPKPTKPVGKSKAA